MMKKFFIYFLFCLPLIVVAQKKELTKEDYIARVKANPDSISTLVDLRRVGGYTPEYQELQSLYNTLGKNVKNSKHILKHFRKSKSENKLPSLRKMIPREILLN